MEVDHINVFSFFLLRNIYIFLEKIKKLTWMQLKRTLLRKKNCEVKIVEKYTYLFSGLYLSFLVILARQTSKRNYKKIKLEKLRI